MKMNIKYLENIINLNDSKVCTIEITNKKYFFRIVNDLTNISNDLAVEDIIFQNQNDEIIDLKGKIKVIINFFELDFDSKSFGSSLTKFIEKNLGNNEINKLLKLHKSFLDYYIKSLGIIDLPLTINGKNDIDTIIKKTKLKIEPKDELLDNLLILIDIEKELKIDSLLVFVNLKQYLSIAELDEFYKYSMYNNIKLILIDSQQYNDKMRNESKLYIDSNLDEFMLS